MDIRPAVRYRLDQPLANTAAADGRRRASSGFGIWDANRRLTAAAADERRGQVELIRDGSEGRRPRLSGNALDRWRNIRTISGRQFHWFRHWFPLARLW